MVTISDIAEAAGVSHVTVSRVLNGDAVYRRAVYARRAGRIRALAEQMGYRPHASARAVRSGRFNCVGLLLSDHDARSSLGRGLLRGLNSVLGPRGLHLSLAILPDARLTDAAYVPTLLRQHMVDGLLINYTDHVPPRMPELIQRHCVPGVWMNVRRPADCVYPDDLTAGAQAARHLLELGHRRIAFVDFSHGPDQRAPHYSAGDRFAGYAAALRQAGLEPRFIGSTPQQGVPNEARVSVMLECLRQAERPTAVVSYAHTSAVPAVHAAALAGLRVPEDLSVVSFDDWPVEFLGPKFTTLVVPHEQVGREAAQALLQRIADPARPTPAVAVPFAFVAGGTCARAPDPAASIRPC